MARTHAHRVLAKIVVIALITATTITASPPPARAQALLPAVAPLRNLSASGCNQSVCIYLTGSGTDVSSWSTTASVAGSICSYATFWADNSVIATGNTVCATNETLQATWNNPGYFAPGTILCNTWANVAGRPCETIYS